MPNFKIVKDGQTVEDLGAIDPTQGAMWLSALARTGHQGGLKQILEGFVTCEDAVIFLEDALTDIRGNMTAHGATPEEKQAYDTALSAWIQARAAKLTDETVVIPDYPERPAGVEGPALALELLLERVRANKDAQIVIE